MFVDANMAARFTKQSGTAGAGKPSSAVPTVGSVVSLVQPIGVPDANSGTRPFLPGVATPGFIEQQDTQPQVQFDGTTPWMSTTVPNVPAQASQVPTTRSTSTSKKPSDPTSQCKTQQGSLTCSDSRVPSQPTDSSPSKPRVVSGVEMLKRIGVLERNVLDVCARIDQIEQFLESCGGGDEDVPS